MVQRRGRADYGRVMHGEIARDRRLVVIGLTGLRLPARPDLPRVVHRTGLRNNQVLVTVDPLAGHVQVTRVGGGLEQEPEQALTNVRERWKGKGVL